MELRHIPVFMMTYIITARACLSILNCIIMTHSNPSEEIFKCSSPHKAPLLNTDTCIVGKLPSITLTHRRWHITISAKHLKCKHVMCQVLPWHKRPLSVNENSLTETSHPQKMKGGKITTIKADLDFKTIKPTREACARCASMGFGRPESPPWDLLCRPKLGPQTE